MTVAGQKGEQAKVAAEEGTTPDIEPHEQDEEEDEDEEEEEEAEHGAETNDEGASKQGVR